MTPPYGARSYAQTRVIAASPLQLVAMLYDGAVIAAGAAHDALVRKDIPARRAAVNKLLGIVAELQNSLDMERGGALAAELDRIYDFVVRQVMEAVSTQSAAPMADAHRILQTLRGAWLHIAEQPDPAAQAGPQP
jgi:flagellar protein FliS